MLSVLLLNIILINCYCKLLFYILFKYLKITHVIYCIFMKYYVVFFTDISIFCFCNILLRDIVTKASSFYKRLRSIDESPLILKRTD